MYLYFQHFLREYPVISSFKWAWKRFPLPMKYNWFLSAMLHRPGMRTLGRGTQMILRDAPQHLTTTLYRISVCEKEVNYIPLGFLLQRGSPAPLSPTDRFTLTYLRQFIFQGCRGKRGKNPAFLWLVEIKILLYGFSKKRPMQSPPSPGPQLISSKNISLVSQRYLDLLTVKCDKIHVKGWWIFLAFFLQAAGCLWKASPSP